MLDHPVGSAPGDTQRTPSVPCDDADDDDTETDAAASRPTADDADARLAPKLHRSEPAACASREPAIVTTVPPSDGPDHGATARTTSETSSKCTPLDVYSRPFVLTSTDACPDADTVVLHTIDDALTYAPPTAVAFMRHSSAPNASADDEKPLPTTVNGVPPSDTPRAGHTDDTAGAGR